LQSFFSFKPLVIYYIDLFNQSFKVVFIFESPILIKFYSIYVMILISCIINYIIIHIVDQIMSPLVATITNIVIHYTYTHNRTLIIDMYEQGTPI